MNGLTELPVLSILVGLPLVAGMVCLFVKASAARWIALIGTFIDFALSNAVNSGDADAVALTPKHPYTQALFAASLPIDVDEPREEITLSGEVPSPLAPPAGCHFHPRCPFAMPHCATQAPALRAESGRLVACHLS